MGTINLALAAIGYNPPLIFNGTQLTLAVANSISISGGAVTLLGDTPNPPPFAYYGTNTGSVLGWNTLPDTITGGAFYSDITGLSGWAITTFATVTNLAATGTTLYSYLVALSGALGATVGATGSTLYLDLTGLSGAFNTIEAAQNAALTSTGSTLYGYIVGASGQANINYATVVNLTATGATLYSDLVGLSGVTNGVALSLAATGTTLYNDILGLSGVLGVTGSTLYTDLLALSGTHNALIASTGQQAWLAAQNNALNLSGQLTVTGALLTATKVTGSSIVNVLNLTGLGGTLVFTSGAFTFISGGAGAAVFDPLGAAAATGQVLYADMIGMSGQFNTNLTQTGVNLLAILAASYATILNVAATGSALYQDIVGLSGAYNLVIAATGQQAWTAAQNNAVNLSGNLTLTGQALYQDIGVLSTQVTGLSGVMNASFAVFPKVTGSFTVSPPVYRYLWSGINGAQWTGTMPIASTVSGQEYLIRNVSTGAILIISGTIDYQTNYTLYGTSTLTLISASDSWVVT